MTVDGIVAVVGATGRQGGAAARALLDAGVSVRALVRDPAKPAAAALASAGAQLVVADFDDPKTVRAAFDGVSRVFAMTTMDSGRGTEGEIADGIAIADAAKAASVDHLIYSSVGGAERHTGIPHFESKRRIEEHIENSDFQRLSCGPPSSTKTCWHGHPPLRTGPSRCVCRCPTASRCKWWPSTTSAPWRRRWSSTRVGCPAARSRSRATS